MKDVTCHLEPNTHFATRERRENSLPPPPWNPKLLAPLAHRRPTLFVVNVTLISTQAPSHKSPYSTYISTTTLSTLVSSLIERLTQFKTHQHLTTSTPKIIHLECNTPMWVILNWRVFPILLSHACNFIVVLMATYSFLACTGTTMLCHSCGWC